MKKSTITLLSLLCLTLVGCGEDKTSTAPIASDNTSTEPTSSSTSEKTITVEEKITDALASGYRSSEVLSIKETWGSDDPYTSYNVFDLGINDDFYQYRQYSAELNEEDGSIVTGSLEYAGTFTHQTGTDGNENVNFVALQIDNVLEYEELLNDEDDTPYLWSDYGFENAFLDFDSSWLVKESDTVYSVDIDSVGETFLHNLSCQVYGMDYSTINEYKIIVDSEGNPVGYSGTFETVEETFYGSTVLTEISFEGTIDETGSDVIKGVTPLTGTADSDLAAALASLSSQNFEYTFTRYTGNYPDDGEYNVYSTAKGVVTEDNLKLVTYYRNGSVNYNGGYYTVDGKTQSVVAIGDGYYKDGDLQDYALSTDVIPSFSNISPLFFDKTADGVYVLNEEKYYTGSDQAYVYSLLNSSYITDLTITLGDDGSVTFENIVPAGGHTAAEKVVEVYSNIGGVKTAPIDTTAVHDTLGTLTWSDIFAGSSDLDDIYTFMGSKANFDSIPTTQDNHSNWSYYFDADSEDLEIQYAASSLTEANTMLSNYDAVMKAAGFSDPTIDEEYGDHIYTKSVEGGTITVTAEAINYYGTAYFLLLPSYAATTTEA